MNSPTALECCEPQSQQKALQHDLGSVEPFNVTRSVNHPNTVIGRSHIRFMLCSQAWLEFAKW